MLESSRDLDAQIVRYHQLNEEHHSTRRENQEKLLQPLIQLQNQVNRDLINDKNSYEEAKENFNEKFPFYRRFFTSSASKYRRYSLQPLRFVYQRRADLAAKLNDLIVQTNNELLPLESRTEWNGGIAVVYDPQTGRAEWRHSRSCGIHGVYNPVTKTIEWEESFHSGVYGVFNPQLNIVEWKKSFKGGVHGVYNPSTRSIEWNQSFHSGVGGVYNPLTEQVEWRTAFKGGVLGYFDEKTETVKWIEKWHHGIALIYWDSTKKTYLTSASCGWFNDE